MLKIDIWPEAQDFLESLTAKHQRQVSAKIFLLAENPKPPHSKTLEGFAPLRRVQSGRYRIVYFIDGAMLKIPLIDKRNDDAVYREVGKKFK